MNKKFLMLTVIVIGVIIPVLVQSVFAGKDRVVLVLFDVSKSTDSATVRERYLKDFELILNNLRPGDVLLVDRIGNNPLAESDFSLRLQFKKFNPLKDNTKYYKVSIKKERERALMGVREMLDNQGKTVIKSKITDGFLVAERVFRNYKDCEKVFVLFTDGVEEGDNYNFFLENLSDKRISVIINRERLNKRIPSLAGVRVYMLGVGAGSYAGMKSEKLLLLEKFWKKYTEATGAILDEYGVSLLNFK